MGHNTNPSGGALFISEDHQVSVLQLTSTSVSEKKRVILINSAAFIMTLWRGPSTLMNQGKGNPDRFCRVYRQCTCQFTSKKRLCGGD